MIYSLNKKCLILSAAALMLSGCSDYDWDKPEWLGESIYEELQRQGNYSIYLGIADDLGMTDMLKQTGSVTVFVADDNAYRQWFTEHGVSEGSLTPSMKRYLFNSSMLGNAYVLEMLTNMPQSDGVKKGEVMRRTNTRWTDYDSIPCVTNSSLPSTSYWQSLKADGQKHNLVDNGAVPMVHFLWQQMETKGITKSDFKYLFNVDMGDDDVYINNVRVQEGNITCQNGYINIMEDVPEPLPNIAQYLESNSSTNLFYKLLSRYSAPFSSKELTEGYQELSQRYASQNLYTALAGGDSIYERHFFWQDADGNGKTAFQGKPVDALLKFDICQNNYIEGGSTSDFMDDMGAVFAPTDKALNEYWQSEDGSFLRNRYPSDEPFDEVPDNVLIELLNNHLQYSFLSSLPSNFNNVLDDAKDPIGLSKDDIDTNNSMVCNNGAVYVMNKVYAPAAFKSVIAPTLVDDNMKIMRWAIQNLEFRPYLLSMVSYYNFIILSDKALERYIDPVSYSGSDPRWFKFYYDERTNTVQAYSYHYDKNAGGTAGCTTEDVKMLNSTSNGDGTYTVNSVVSNRLNDLLNFCILPRNVNGGNLVGEATFLTTKTDGAMEAGSNANSFRDQFTGNMVEATEKVEKENGYYYVADEMIQPTMTSLVDILNSNDEYTEFYNLLLGNEKWTNVEQNQYAILKRANSGTYTLNDDNTGVRSFNSYQYTVYIPNNAAMKKAYANGLPTWDDINNLDNVYAGTDVDVDSLKKTYTKRIINFLKYHFQDNSLFIGADEKSGNYETAAMYESGEKEGMSYTVNVNLSKSDLTVTGQYVPAWTTSAKVITSNSLMYNNIIREYSLNGKTYNDNISTSSWAAVHCIDQPLLYSEECLCLKDNEKKN